MVPFGHISLFVTFASSMDDTLRTSLPKEVRIALRSQKALFYQEGLVLSVSASIQLPPQALLQRALLTLICIHQGDMVPTPTERPRQISDVIAEVPSQGHAPWLARLLENSPIDTADGFRPLPWLTPSLAIEGGILFGSLPATCAPSSTIAPCHSDRGRLSTGGPNPSWWQRER